MLTSITYHIITFKSSPTQKDSPKPSDPITVVPSNRIAQPLDGGKSVNIGGMWTLTHEIRSPKLYELLIKIELKGGTALGLKNFYNHTKMCLNEVTRLQQYLLTGYHFINRHSEFAEYFILDRDHPSYSWNVQIYTSLGHSLLVATTNGTCVKYSMAPQAYKVISTHEHEISGWEILTRALHSREPHLGGMNGDVHSDLANLAFNNGEELKYFHSIILRLQQEIILSVENVSPTRLIFQCMT